MCFPVFAGGISLGAEGGLSLSHFTGRSANTWDTKTDVCGYGFLNVPINNEWAVLCEAGYTAKGTYSSTFQSTLTLDYIEIPLLMRYSFQSMSAYPTSVYVGPAFGFLVSAQQLYNGSTTDLTNVQSSDIGLTVGGMLEVPLNFGSLFFDIRYTQGFINPLSGNIGYNQYDLKNCTLSIMAGLNFYLNPISPPAESGGTNNLIQ
jgi:hypothetical protein